MATPTFPDLASNLRERRKANERSIAYVARKAGISKTYLWELEMDCEGKKAVSAAIIYQKSPESPCL